MAQRCFDRLIFPINVAYPKSVSLALQQIDRDSMKVLTFRVVIADGEDSGSTTGVTCCLRKIWMAICVAVLRCSLTGWGAVISIAANGSCLAPHHLAVVSPVLEIRIVWVSLAVRLGVIVNLIVVKQVGDQSRDVASIDSSSDVLSVVTVACCPAHI